MDTMMENFNKVIKDPKIEPKIHWRTKKFVPEIRVPLMRVIAG